MSRRGRRPKGRRLAATGLGLALAVAAPVGAATELLAGTAIERRLEPRESHRYQLTVNSASYLRLSADQSELDLRLRLIDPSEQTLATVDVAARPWLPETLALVVEGPGAYLVEVEQAGGPGRSGVYKLNLEAVRPARPEDAQRVAAETAMQKGRDLLARGGENAPADARRLFEGALEAARGIADPALQGELLHHLAGTRELEGEPAEAIELFREALARRQQAGDTAGAAATLNLFGQTLQNLGEVDEARRRFAEALELARELPDRATEALTLNNLGTLDFAVGRIADAADNLELALVLHRESGNDAGRATTLGNLGVIHRRLGRLDDAAQAYREALELARKMDDVQNELSVINKLGVLYRVRGEIQLALETYTNGIKVARREGHFRREEADLNSNLGWLWSLLGYPDRALELHHRALELNREADRASGVAGELMRIGWLYESIGKADAALDYLEEAVPISEASGDVRNQTFLQSAIGRARLELGESETAIRHLERSVQLAASSSDRSAQVGALRDLGRARLASGDLPGANAALAEGLILSHEVGDPYKEASVRLAVGRLRRAEGKLGAARTELESALTTIEGLRSDLASQEFRASFLSRRRDDYVYLVDLLMEMHRLEPQNGFDRAAFGVSERSRARSFVELLTEAMQGARRGIDADLARRERQTTQQIGWTQRDLMRTLAGPRTDPQRVSELRDQLERLQGGLERVEWELRQKHPRYAEVRYPLPVDLATVQATLGPDTALLEYLLGEPRSYLFVVTRQGLEALELPSAAEIRPLVQETVEALGSPGRRRLGAFQHASPRLYDRLIRPAHAFLEGKRQLRIAPDGALYYLPFEALLAETGPLTSTRPFLLSRWAVSYVPSASALSSIRDGVREPTETTVTHDLIAFGDPLLPGLQEPAPDTAFAEPLVRSLEADDWVWRRLPGTRREVEALARLFPPERVEIYLGAAARESQLKRNPRLANTRFLHLASHAFVDSRRPAYSSLLMTPEQSGAEDGLLQVHEIFDLQLGAELVVLSACETGLGRQVRGEGLVGLSRAFIFAGARSVAVSLWPVADQSTAELMVAFYRRLRDGEPKTEALRGAKLELLRSARFSHPYYWAPFILTGDAS